MSSATIKGISFGIFSLVYMELLQEAKKILIKFLIISTFIAQ